MPTEGAQLDKPCEVPAFCWDAALWSGPSGAQVLAALQRHSAIICHALGNPLTGLMLSLDLLASLPLKDAAQTRYVQRAEHAAQRLAELKESLGNLGGQASDHTQALCLADLIDEAIAQVGLDASYKVSLSLQQASTVWANAQALREALGHLLRNAMEASPGGVALGVHASALPDGVRLSVWDRGPGMRPDLVPKLFTQPLMACDSRKGMGLLLVAVAIQRCHGGRVGYTPCAGGGTAIHLDLPTKGPT